MFDAVHRHADQCDVCILCAAVADYKPAKVSPAKIKKARREPLARINSHARHSRFARSPADRRFLVVGFAAETNDVEENARRNFATKNCDIMVGERCERRRFGMESDENELTILFRDGEMRKISRASKKIIAHELVKIFSEFATKTFDKKNEMITERN